MAGNLDKTEEKIRDRARVSAPFLSVLGRGPLVLRGLLRRVNKALVVGVLLSSVVGFGAGWLGGGVRGNGGNVSNGIIGSQNRVVSSEGQLVNSIAKSLGQSVVSVNVISSSRQSSGLFGLALPQSEQSAGTGIIISSDGLIITNRHVVPEGTTSVSVTLSDGTEMKDVSVLGRTSANSTLDVAFLKITDAHGHKLTPAVLGDSSQVGVGDTVIAIGNALGQFQNTVTSGIISGHGRSVQAGDASGAQASENLVDLFQTDAAINEGNSGGPLVDLNGQVIGINTAIAGGAQNIGFAIPINDVKGLIQQVESTGQLLQPYLGVVYVSLTDDVASQYDLKVKRGAWVPPVEMGGRGSVIPGGPADKAGLKPGDIITKIDGANIDENNSLTSIISRDHVGQSVSLTVVRGGKTLTVQVTLEAMPSAASAWSSGVF